MTNQYAEMTRNDKIAKLVAQHHSTSIPTTTNPAFFKIHSPYPSCDRSTHIHDGFQQKESAGAQNCQAKHPQGMNPIETLFPARVALGSLGLEPESPTVQAVPSSGTAQHAARHLVNFSWGTRDFAQF